MTEAEQQIADFKARAETLEQRLNSLSRETLSSQTEPEEAQDEGEMMCCDQISVQ